MIEIHTLFGRKKDKEIREPTTPAIEFPKIPLFGRIKKNNEPLDTVLLKNLTRRAFLEGVGVGVGSMLLPGIVLVHESSERSVVVLTNEAEEKLRSFGLSEYSEYYKKTAEMLYVFGYSMFQEITNILSGIISGTIAENSYEVQTLLEGWQTARNPQKAIEDAQALVRSIDPASISDSEKAEETLLFLENMAARYPMYFLSGPFSLRVEKAIAAGQTSYSAYTDGENVTGHELPDNQDSNARRWYEFTMQHELNHHIDHERLKLQDLENLKAYITIADVTNYMTQYVNSVYTILYSWAGASIQEASKEDFVLISNHAHKNIAILRQEVDDAANKYAPRWLAALKVSDSELQEYISLLPQEQITNTPTGAMKKRIISWLYTRKLIEAARNDQIEHTRLVTHPDLEDLRIGKYDSDNQDIYTNGIMDTLAHELVDPLSDGKTFYGPASYSLVYPSHLLLDAARARLLSPDGIPPTIYERRTDSTPEIQIRRERELKLHSEKLVDIFNTYNIEQLYFGEYRPGKHITIYRLPEDTLNPNDSTLYVHFNDRMTMPAYDIVYNPKDFLIQVPTTQFGLEEQVTGYSWEETAQQQWRLTLTTTQNNSISIDIYGDAMRRGTATSSQKGVNVDYISPEINIPRFMRPQIAEFDAIMSNAGGELQSGKVLYYIDVGQHFRIFPIPPGFDTKRLDSLYIIGGQYDRALGLDIESTPDYTTVTPIIENYFTSQLTKSIQYLDGTFVIGDRFIAELEHISTAEFNQKIAQLSSHGFEIHPEPIDTADGKKIQLYIYLIGNGVIEPFKIRITGEK